MDSKRRYAALVAAALLTGGPAAEAHRPPRGHALEHTAEQAGHFLEVMVVPKAPRSGGSAELIVGIREQQTGRAYRGYVTFLVAPPGGEAEPLGIPLEFEPGYFESVHVFRQPGVHRLTVVFDVGGNEQRVGPVLVAVRIPSRLALGVALGLAALTAVTYAAAFRQSRRRTPPAPRYG